MKGEGRRRGREGRGVQATEPVWGENDMTITRQHPHKNTDTHKKNIQSVTRISGANIAGT